MLKKRILAGILTATLAVSAWLPAGVAKVEAADANEITIEKSTLGNPILGFDGNGDLAYGGDPAAFVDGDTVYLIVGHDTSTGSNYVMPEWYCYSSQDMMNWTFESTIFKATDISWRNDNTSAWAGQATEYNGMYYFYYCTWDKTSNGKQSIGVAVSESPTGPYVDPLGKPLVSGAMTDPQTSDWNDIDPTVWIETDEDGEEHRYLGWGNGKYYICELNEDMISVKDMNGDGEIKDDDDIVEQKFVNMSGHGFTEAPWLYRQQDESGEYFGPYYTFMAVDWREQMGYATTDDLSSGTWEFQGLIQPPTATSNTTHMSVINFNEKTYLIYHNGSLPYGSGYRRVACVEEFTFNEDGSIDMITETATGVSGFRSIIMDMNGAVLGHENFTNTTNDNDYPIRKAVSFYDEPQNIEDARWEIVPGKSDKTKDSYVSIEAYNKPGLYLAVTDTDVVMTQDADGKEATALSMTFKTVEGLNGTGVSFESVSKPGFYLTNSNGTVTLTEGNDPDACSYILDTVTKVEATKSKTEYFVGDTLNVDDLTVKISYQDGREETITTGYTTNVGEIKMNKSGDKTLTVSYEYDSTVRTCDIPIKVNKKEVSSVTAQKTKTAYTAGDALNVDDIKVTAAYNNGTTAVVAGYVTNAAAIDMNTAGTKTLVVTYTEGTVTKTCNIAITVAAKAQEVKPVEIPKAVLATGETYTVKGYKYKVTKLNAKGGGNVTFAGAVKKNVKGVVIPATVTIKGVKLNVTAIADKALSGNKKLKSVTVGKNVTKIGKSAFQNCSKLKTITVNATKLKSVGKSALKGINAKAKIKVPKKQLAKYKQLFKGKGQKKTVKIVK